MKNCFKDWNQSMFNLVIYILHYLEGLASAIIRLSILNQGRCVTEVLHGGSKEKICSPSTSTVL